MTIRVAIIGLSAHDGTGFRTGNWGVQAHLAPLILSPHYTIVAICNSTTKSAQAAIDFHKLPSSVKAYGSPEELANDPDVDLVAVSVNVAKHLLLGKPALLTKKDVFMEWPLGASLGEAEELAQLANAQGVKTMVGLQLRADPLVTKIKGLLKEGSIGRVTSSMAWGCSSVIPADMWIADAAYYLDMKSGGNEFYIFFGHILDTFTDVMGTFDVNSLQAILKTQTPTIALRSTDTGKVTSSSHPKTAPDHILVQGELTSGALASVAFRKTKKPADGLGLRWLITGTDGEIEVTIPESHLQMGAENRAIRVRTGSDEVAKNVAFDNPKEPEYITKVSVQATNTARLYESFAQGDGLYATFDSALETHKLLDTIARKAKFI